MLLKIVQVGEPGLRQRARPLTSDEIRSPGLVNLIELMRATMDDAPGVGLAAPQIGEPLQVAVIEDRAEAIVQLPADDVARKKRRPVPFHVIINPKLTLLEQEPPVTFYEGCLSVHGFVAAVPRAAAVRVEALDHRGTPVVIEADGWYARILQHEIDHLAGTLYIDRMDTRTFASMEARMRALASGATKPA